MKQKIVEELSKVEYVCTTADIWSAHNRSFFGVTAHWIDPTTLTRRSAALACSRMVGRHTFGSIAEQLHSVHSSFHIAWKVVMTVTDNASNFVKAFKEFARTEDDDNDDDIDHEVMVHDVDNLLAADNDDDTLDVGIDEALYLPPHQRCSSHTLNLVAVSDTEVANQDGNYKRISRATLSKCSALWNKTSRSTVSADIVSEKLNTCFIVPNDTHWNSQYRAVEKIKKLLDQQPEHMREICQALGVVPFNVNETNFIREYCSVMQPLACALDILQAETKCFIGYLLPTLSTLKMKLRALRSN